MATKNCRFSQAVGPECTLLPCAAGISVPDTEVSVFHREVYAINQHLVKLIQNSASIFEQFLNKRLRETFKKF